MLSLTGARTGIDMKFSREPLAYGLSKSLVFRLAGTGEMRRRKEKCSYLAVIARSTIDTTSKTGSQCQAKAGPFRLGKGERTLLTITYFLFH